MYLRLLLLALLTLSLATPALATTRLVLPDGTGDVVTIQDGINASAVGDTVLLGDGVFTGAGNVNFGLTGTLIVMRSINGPKATSIEPGPGARGFSNPGGADSWIIGITIRGGNVAGGGAVDMDNTAMVFENCIFEENTATDGGAIRIRGASNPTFRNCTFVANAAANGNHLHFQSSAGAQIERCIFAFGGAAGGGVASCNGATPTWDCNVVYGNLGGDALCGTVIDNVVADPLFCDLPSGDFTLDQTSPAAPAQSACGLLIGACPVICGATPVEESTWGRLKRSFRD